MRIILVIVGVVVIVLGLIRHFLARDLPRIGFQLIRLPGYAIAVLGVLITIAGFLLN